MGDMISTLLEVKVSLWRYRRKATLCRATEVLPEPAAPCMISSCAVSFRMMAFCSCWMVATIFFIFSSDVLLSSFCSTSSWMFMELSIIYSI